MKKLRTFLIILIAFACMSISVTAYDAALPAEKVTMVAASEINEGDSLFSNTDPSDLSHAVDAAYADTLSSTEDYYVYVADNSYGATFIKNTEAKVDFIVGGSRSDYYLCIALADDENIYAYSETPLSDFNSTAGVENVVTLTISLDNTIPVGDYYLLYGIVDAEGNDIVETYYIDFSVVNNAILLTGISIYNAEENVTPVSQMRICPDDYGIVGLIYSPENATGYRSVVFESSDESIFTVDTWGGYGYISPVSDGHAMLYATVNGNVKTSIPVYIGHEYNAGTHMDPGCDYDGYTTYTCDICRQSYKETIPATGHDFGDNEAVIVTAPTACKPGEATQYCTRCAQDISIVLPPIFTDVDSSKYYVDAVDHFHANGIIKGMTDTTFEPNTPLTRGMLITMVYRMAGSPECNVETPFTDVPATAYYADAVAWAYENNITEGMTATTFEPATKITREQLATFLYRYAIYQNVDTSGAADLTVFPDYDQVFDYASAPFAWAVDNGIITGSRDYDVIYLAPKRNASRAEAATMLYRYLNYAEENQLPEVSDDTQPTDPEPSPAPTDSDTTD